jgi:hypothetical protein
MDMYLSESRINAEEEEVLDQENIKPGGKSIDYATPVYNWCYNNMEKSKPAKRSSILVDLSPSLTAII